MDGDHLPSGAGVEHATAVVRTVHVDMDHPDPVAALAAGLGPGPFALVTLFCTPCAPLSDLLAGLGAALPEARVIGCTTAGEISDRVGYAENCIVAFGLPAAHFRAETIPLPDLDATGDLDLIGKTIRARTQLHRAAPELPHEFALLLVDGLSMQEDALASALAASLGTVPLFGGSAGDGTRFEHALVGWDGRARENAAVLVLIRTDCPVRVFTLNHFRPTDQRMVVTKADPSQRLVQEINAEPAARELGRLLGKDPEQVDTFTFAGSPVVVRLGGTHHVRAIKRVTEGGDLEFFSAIDEGLVLTIAEAAPMIEHLRGELEALATPVRPDAIIGCDCILRRIEARQKQATHGLSALLRQHRVIGFSTYGEQINGMHVNQTMTGVAIYPPAGQGG